MIDFNNAMIAYLWRKVPKEYLPPEKWENWRREKQASYLKIETVFIQLKRYERNWIYKNCIYKKPDDAVKHYLMDLYDIKYIPSMFFNYLILMIERQLPDEYKWLNISGCKLVEPKCDTYRKQALEAINNFTIDGIVSDSLKSDEYFKNKPVTNPIEYWGLMPDKNDYKEILELLGIQFIKDFTQKLISSSSVGGWPDLVFVDKIKKKIEFLEVKTLNDRMRDNQYVFYKEFCEDGLINYQLVFLDPK